MADYTPPLGQKDRKRKIITTSLVAIAVVVVGVILFLQFKPDSSQIEGITTKAVGTTPTVPNVDPIVCAHL